MPHTMEHCHRPWWKRPPFWFVVIAVVLLSSVFVIEHTDKPALTPYSVFLDQLEADNVASVSIRGTEIDGRYKHPLDSAPPSGAKAQRDSFRSRVPDFGDPSLIPALRKQRVAIEVSPPSPWSSLLARLPWPMLLLLGVAIVAGFVRLMRGGKAQSGSAAAALPAHGIIGLVSRLFARRDQTASPPTNEGDEPKNR